MVRISKKIKSDKISKGYRLRTSTHRLIGKMQEIMNANQDSVITKACRMLFRDLQHTKKMKVNPKVNKLI
jgi:hypothetical protein